MADLALKWVSADGAADLAIEGSDLATDGGLETAILLSLFTDRRADPADVLPDAETDRRGWWGDAVPVAEGDLIGSRLWLLAREKRSISVVRRAEEYAREALQWLLDDRIAERLDVTGEVGAQGELLLSISIHRPQRVPVDYRYTLTWAAQARRD